MANQFEDSDLDEFRGWKFDAVSREQQLERRVKELETAIDRLEREIRTQRLGASYDHQTVRPKSIGDIVGTLGGVLPASPYKAD